MRITWIILLCSMFMAGCHRAGPSEESGDAGGHASSSLRELMDTDLVAIGPLTTRTVDRTVQATGSIAIPPTDLRSIHARSSGFVHGMRYLPGDRVSRGAMLFRIEQPTLVARQRELLETRAELEYAKQEFDRAQTLQEGGAGSGESFQKAVAERDLLRSRYLGLRRELELTGLDVDALESDGEFQSMVPVYAPSSGFVHEVYVNAGQMVRPEDRLMDIADNSHLHLELNIFSRDLPVIRTGQEVRFSVPGRSEWMEAKVEKLNPMLDPRNNTLKVHCHIAESYRELVRPGMFASAEIHVEALEVTGLPSTAVIREGTRYYAFGQTQSGIQRVELSNVTDYGELFTFDPVSFDSMVVRGAYYIE